MWNGLVLGGVGAFFVLWLFRNRGPSLLQVVREAQQQKNIQPIMNAVNELSGKKRSFFFQQSIDILWQKYERELAAQLILQFANTHPEEKLSQYWILKVLECEPDTAEATFPRSFLEETYRPEVAQCCGVASS